MVNPNDPNSEPDGTPPSDPTPDPNSGDSPDTPSSESGPISDELFDSLSDLLGDADEPDTDEPLSLPDIESWSDQPAEATSPSATNVDEPTEEPTLIRFDTEVESVPGSEETSSLEPRDTTSVEPSFTTATPDDSLGSVPPRQSSGEDLVPDLWADEGPADAPIPTDDWSTPDIESPLLSADITESSEPLSSDAAAAGDRSETSSDPWTDQPPAEVSPADPITEDLDDPTIVQGAPTVIQPVSNADSTPDATDELSNIEPPIEDQPQDVWADELSSDPASDEDRETGTDVFPETTVPVSEPTEPVMAVPPPTEESMSAWGDSDDASVSPPSISSEAVNADDSALESAASLEAAETAVPSDETLGMPVEEGDGLSTPPPIPPIPTDSGSTADPSRDRDPEPIPVATGAGSSPPSFGIRPISTGDLGPLSGKLPLNRYQSVGLLVAMSTLGTITYLGITGNKADQSPITPGAITSLPTPEVATRATPPSGVPVVPPQPQGRTALTVQPTPEPDTETPNVSSPEAIGGIAPAAAPSPSKLDISDVPVDHWAYPFITKLHAQGIIPDYPDGKFEPDRPVTRAELAAQIQKAFVNEPGQRPLTFSDIPADYWAAAAIEGAVDKKFMSGYPAADFQADEQIPRFQPNKKVPRYEVLVALASGLELDPNSPVSSLQRFQDQGQLPDWSKGKIAASTLGGMVVNHPDPVLLEPETNATRAEVAVMIHQALVQKGQLEPIDSEFVVKPEQ